jgi:hypothetical protein
LMSFTSDRSSRRSRPHVPLNVVEQLADYAPRAEARAAPSARLSRLSNESNLRHG